jgi:hypothetical protein
MLLYPVPSGQSPSGQAGGGGSASSPQQGALLGTASAAGAAPASAAATGPTWNLPNSTVPVVLFAWNANRVVPVRLTTLTITETIYDANLKATHAQAQISLRVLTPTELAAANPAPGTPADLAITAYNRTFKTRSRWAANNTASNPVSPTSMPAH